EYVRHKREAEARRAVAQAEQSPYDDQLYDALVPYSGQHLEASQNSELAISMAQKEISRRAAARSVREDDDDLSRQIQQVAAHAERQRRAAGVEQPVASRN